MYEGIVRFRNFLYDRQYLKTLWLDAPVISVGNLTTGGTGKTPMVILAATLARDAGMRPGVILRGYGRTADREADEVLLLRRELPGVPVVANPDRIEGGRQAMDQSAEILIADDAFQHRRLGRDLNICLVDACFPFGGGSMLPAGRLREPLSALRRADVVVLTRSDQVSPEALEALRSAVRAEAGEIPLLTGRHQVRGFRDVSGRASPEAPDRRVFAFAGIARPESFFRALADRGLTVAGTRTFRDHHDFTAADLRSLREAADHVGAAAMVCTAKDLIKLSVETAGQAGIEAARLVAMEIEMVLSDGERVLLRDRIVEAAARAPKKEGLCTRK